jgi:signal transduction histidine kinase
MAPVDANSICQLSIQTVREDVSRKSLDLVFIPADPPVLLEADAPSLKRILVNLLSNAVKFTPEGGKITLQVLTDAAHATVFFVVEDTGIGIAPEHVEQIFAPFVQLGGGLTRLYEGAGLGLTLVEQLVKLHGGTVTVHSEGASGQGSRFVVSLPRQAEARQKATFPEV